MDFWEHQPIICKTLNNYPLSPYKEIDIYQRNKTYLYILIIACIFTYIFITFSMFVHNINVCSAMIERIALNMRSCAQAWTRYFTCASVHDIIETIFSHLMHFSSVSFHSFYAFLDAKFREKFAYIVAKYDNILPPKSLSAWTESTDMKRKSLVKRWGFLEPSLARSK